MSNELIKIKEKMEILLQEVMYTKITYSYLTNMKINGIIDGTLVTDSFELSLIIKICKIYEIDKQAISLNYMFRTLLSSSKIKDKSFKEWLKINQEKLNGLLLNIIEFKEIRDTELAHIDKKRKRHKKDYKHLLKKSEEMIDFALDTILYIFETIFAEEDVLIKYQSYFEYEENFKEEK